MSEGRFIRLVERNGWEYVERKNLTGIVAVVALTPSREVLLVEQHREPVGGPVLELPAGIVGDLPGAAGEAFAAAAARELHEETGYAAGSMSFLTEGPPSCGLSSERVDFFLARDARKTGEGGGVDGEKIITHAVPLDCMQDWLAAMRHAGVLIDPKVYTGFYFVCCEQRVKQY